MTISWTGALGGEKPAHAGAEVARSVHHGALDLPPRASGTVPAGQDPERVQRYLDSAFSKSIDAVSSATEGERNDTLNREAFALAGLVRGGHLPEHETRAALADAAKRAGLREHETAPTIDSAFTAAEPRDLPDMPIRPKRQDADPGEPPPDDGPDPTDDDAPDAPPPSKDSVRVEARGGKFVPVETAPRAPLTISSIVTRWREEGPVVRLSTGIDGIDRLSRGGVPAIWRTAIVGAPTAGKTYIAARIANHHLVHHQIPVGWLGVDEDPEDIAIRFGQMHGLLLHDLESCTPAALDNFQETFAALPLRLFDATFTIEAAAAALRAEYPDGPATLVIDSIQTVASALAGDARSPREMVEAAVRSVRAVQCEHRLGVFFTSEANRNSYRNDDAAETTNDLAAGAESRALEYGAQSQLMLRTPKDHPDVVRVRIAKNRRADRGEFWIHLLRPAHDLEECGDPTSTPEAREEREQEARARVSESVRRDAEEIARIVQRQPGIGTRQLRDALRIAGHKWGPERIGAAMTLLECGATGVRLVNRGEQGRGQPCLWHAEPVQDRRQDDDDD